MAEYLSDGTWVVVTNTNTPLGMIIVCESISDNKEIMIKPPVDLLRLRTNCSAYNDRLSVLHFYYIETKLNIDESFDKLIQTYSCKYSDIWNEFHKYVPNFKNKNKNLPKELSSIDSISMDSLISELNKVEKITVEPKPKPLIPSWVSIMLTIFIIIL